MRASSFLRPYVAGSLEPSACALSQTARLTNDGTAPEANRAAPSVTAASIVRIVAGSLGTISSGSRCHIASLGSRRHTANVHCTHTQ